MKSLTILNCIIVFWIVFNRTIKVQSDCNVCNAKTNTACFSQTEFQQCENDQPFGTVFKCNPNSFCSILGNCTPLEELSDCQLCKKCDASQTFACTGTQTFALCLGDEKPSEITGQCTGSLTCNINNSKICGNTTSTCSLRDNPLPTTTTEAPTTTTPSPVQDPNGFCQFFQKEGRYPVGTNPQTTCRQYISCVKIGTNWYGPVYNCPGQTYFDSSKNGCVVEIPKTCGGTTFSHFSFRNILLE